MDASTIGGIATGFDWGNFLSIALPTLFTTLTTIAGYIAGQKSKVNATALDKTVAALTVAAQALGAAVAIAQAAQQSQGGKVEGGNG